MTIKERHEIWMRCFLAALTGISANSECINMTPEQIAKSAEEQANEGLDSAEKYLGVFKEMAEENGSED